MSGWVEYTKPVTYCQTRNEIKIRLSSSGWVLSAHSSELLGITRGQRGYRLFWSDDDGCFAVAASVSGGPYFASLASNEKFPRKVRAVGQLLADHGLRFEKGSVLDGRISRTAEVVPILIFKARRPSPSEEIRETARLNNDRARLNSATRAPGAAVHG